MGFWNFIGELFRLLVFALWNKITENYPLKPPAEPKHVVSYPEEYTKEYFSGAPNNYRWNPIYKAPVNHLYNNEYMFKYPTPKKYRR